MHVKKKHIWFRICCSHAFKLIDFQPLVFGTMRFIAPLSIMLEGRFTNHFNSNHVLKKRRNETFFKNIWFKCYGQNIEQFSGTPCKCDILANPRFFLGPKPRIWGMFRANCPFAHLPRYWRTSLIFNTPEYLAAKKSWYHMVALSMIPWFHIGYQRVLLFGIIHHLNTCIIMVITPHMTYLVLDKIWLTH